MAVFGLPKLHEDDALRAVRTALDMEMTLRELNVRLQATWGVSLENRVGVNTGEVATSGLPDPPADGGTATTSSPPQGCWLRSCTGRSATRSRADSRRSAGNSRLRTTWL